MRLSELNINEKGIITKVMGRGAFRKRITEMGFVKGKEVTVIKSAPLQDPIEYEIMGYQISLRTSEAHLIEVVASTEVPACSISFDDNPETLDCLTEWKNQAIERKNTINIALVGNPNCGKTTLFNVAAGANEHVGNYSGVTVDAKVGRFVHGQYKINLIDLPGTYSLTAYSPEELYVRNYIFDEVPDVVVNVIDASNLERNLYLTTQLIDMDIKVVVALNMYDELQERGDRLDYESLGKMIGIPFVPTVASKRKGITELFDKIVQVYEDSAEELRHIHIHYGDYAEAGIQNIQHLLKIPENNGLIDLISSRYLSIKLLEKDKHAIQLIKKKAVNGEEILILADLEVGKLEKILEEDSETIITDAKYGFISGAVRETFKEGVLGKRKKTDVIDTFLTHRLFGFPIFIFFIWLMFQSTFTLGSYPVSWIESLVGFLSSLISNGMQDGMLRDLMIDGIIGGVGGVIVFLPNIVILFFFISLMEDTGYMARVAFIMDKLMHKIGLHGKSFIPLIMGFGCNVPAIMATRTLENRNDRLLTMLINPLMSCSARLPVYILITGAFFGEMGGTVLFSIYFIGIFLAILMAILLKKTVFRSEDVPFVMELPPYRIPTVRSTTRHMWSKAAQYLKKMGGVILVSSIIIWALGYFPQNFEGQEQYDIKKQVVIEKYASMQSFSGNVKLNNERDSIIHRIDLEKESVRQKNSYIGRLGVFFDPIMSPLGFDWKMGVSIISGVAGKEIVVSTLAVLFQADDDAGHSGLQQNLKNEKDSSGRYVFDPLVAFTFLLFILIYFPCVAVIAAIKKESGSWKWAAFASVYTTVLAWLVCFIVYQVGSLII